MGRLVRHALSLLLALAAATAAPVGSPSHASPGVERREGVDWQTLPYQTRGGKGPYFSIGTTATYWKGATTVADVGSAFAFPHATPESTEVPTQAVWKKSCPTKKPATVSIRRTVLLPGAPAQMDVGLLAYTAGRKNPFTSVELKLNGVTVAKTGRADPHTWTLLDVSDRAGAVTYGSNTLTLVARHGKLKKPQDYCLDGRSLLGVAAVLYLEPEVQVSATVPPYSGTGVSIDTTATLANAGPSTVAGAGSSDSDFWINSTDSPSGKVTRIVIGGLAGCVTSDGASSYGVSCPLPELGPGESATVSIHLEFQPLSCNLEIPVGYGAPTYWRDPVQSDNYGSRAITANACRATG